MKDGLPEIEEVGMCVPKAMDETVKGVLFEMVKRLMEAPPKTWLDETKKAWVVSLH